MELTKDQINHLFDFVRSKYVRYIDVQHELVDHLATAIEEKMEQNHKLDFARALNQVYAGFPITGFVYFVEQKEKALRQFWKARYIKYLKSFLTWPKIVLSFAMTYIWFYIIQVIMITNSKLLLTAALIFVFALIIHELFFKIYTRKYKEYLSVVAFQKNQLTFMIFIYIPAFHLFSDLVNSVDYGLYFQTMYAILGCIYTLEVYLSLIVFPKMIVEDVKELKKHLTVS